MSGIFLSYSRADRALADQVVRSLRALGAEVWWDEDMPGVNWQRELARQIHQLAAVLVIWSPTSVASDSVADEARLAKSERKLVNALSRTKEPPFPFEAINGLPLDGWTGREPHNGWTRLVRTLDDLLAQAGGAPGALTKALADREAAIAAKGREIGAAEEAFQAAQGADTEASAAAEAADAALQAADAQMRRVLDLHGSSALMRVAQAELDAALAARDEAEAARKAAQGALEQASRAVTRARAELERTFEQTRSPGAPPLPPAAAEPQAMPEPKPAPAAVLSLPPVAAAAIHASGRGPVIAGVSLVVVAILAVIGVVATRPSRPASTNAVMTNAAPTSIADTNSPTPPSGLADDPRVQALAGVWSQSSSQCVGLIVRISVRPTGTLDQTTIMGTVEHAKINAVDPDGLVETTLDGGAPRYYRLSCDTITTHDGSKNGQEDELHHCPDDTPLTTPTTP
jgi:hypothetical protein